MMARDVSDVRQPALQDPWPGGHTFESWPCWCPRCMGLKERSRHQRDTHMLKWGVLTTSGVIDAIRFNHPQYETELHVGDEDPSNVEEGIEDIEEDVEEILEEDANI